MIKILNKLGKRMNGFNILKAIYEKSLANILLNDEKLKALPLRSGTRQWCILLPLLFNIVLEALTRTIRQERSKQASKLERKKITLPLLVDDTHLHESIETFKDSTHTTHSQTVRSNKRILGYPINKNQFVSVN